MTLHNLHTHASLARAPPGPPLPLALLNTIFLQSSLVDLNNDDITDFFNITITVRACVCVCVCVYACEKEKDIEKEKEEDKEER
jgi:hypothetical protein